MAYRSIPRPRKLPADTEAWVQWADSEALLPSVAPIAEGACRLCYGAVGQLSEGGYFPYCQHCVAYRDLLEAVVPIAYSPDSGLESLLHRYKDFGPEYLWMARPLVSAIYEFLKDHRKCLKNRFGAIDRWLTMPSGNADRQFDHLRYALEKIDAADWPIRWEFDVIERAKPGRPGRGVVDPSFYRLADGESVEGETVVVLDDTWTSGSSLASVAAMLRSHGAWSIIGITVGRQLHAGWGSSDDLLRESQQRRFNRGRCVLDG